MANIMDFDNYEDYRDSRLREGGFNPEDLTDEQKSVILEPEEAPENYYCDGEVSGSQAFSMWKHRLRNSGLTQNQIQQAIYMM